MEGKIDLDAIISKVNQEDILWLNAQEWENVKKLMIETAHQALVLASEKATLHQLCSEWRGEMFDDPAGEVIVDKQSILDVEKLIS